MISKVIYDADIDNFFFFNSATKKNLFRDEARDEMKGCLRRLSGNSRQAIALDRGAAKACVRSSAPRKK